MSQLRERRLISEWRALRHPSDQHILGCPLGAVDEETVRRMGLDVALRMLKPWRLEADAVVITADRLIVAEAKVYQIRNAVGDLIVYRGLVPETPELKPYLDRKLELVLVCPWSNTLVETLCRQNGIRLDLYSPEWVREFITEHQKYWTREYVSAREDKKALRKALGVD